jgi:hypothetical protein
MADQKVRIQTPLGKFTDPTANGYLNCIHANTVSLWSYFAKQLWGNDLSRVVYASDDFAFARRVELNAEAKTQGLNMPFQNFKLVNVTKGSQRPWFNHQLAVDGIPDYTINKKIRMIPMTLNFESTIYVSTEADSQWLQQKLLWENSLETKIRPEVDLTVNNATTMIDLIGVVTFDTNYNPTYSERDWLERNKIRTIALDNLQVQSWVIHDSIRNATYALTKKIILQIYEMSPTEEFAQLLFDQSFVLADFQ